jgi:hypothetical protein
LKHLIALAAASIALSAACGGAAKAAPTATTQSVIPAATAAPSPSATPPVSAAAAQKAVGSIFSTLFSSGAISAASGSSSTSQPASAGDSSLKQYLLKANQFPAGYDNVEETSTRVSDGVSASGTIDVAASVATRGDAMADDPTGVSILGSMVMKPQDLQALGSALSSANELTDQDLEDAISGSAGTFGGLKIGDVHLLDASGLGDGGFGMSLSMDLSGLADIIGTPTTGSAALPKLQMRIYLFAHGNYLGGIVHVAFGALDPEGVDLALAHLVDANLQSAP